jgi:hypothetical protein
MYLVSIEKKRLPLNLVQEISDAPTVVAFYLKRTDMTKFRHNLPPFPQQNLCATAVQLWFNAAFRLTLNRVETF